jgi:N-ethylmaleimide reductase
MSVRQSNLKLFTPVQLGSLNLKHRVVMAPLTRSRAEQPGGIPGDMMVQYYSDRASDGDLIISGQRVVIFGIVGHAEVGSTRSYLGSLCSVAKC